MMQSRIGRLADAMRGLAAARAAAAYDRLETEARETVKQARFAALVRHAATRSPWYAELYRGLDLREVTPSALPTVTKSALMERFDDWVTDPRLRLADIDQYLAAASGDTLHLGEYRAVATGGTSGRRGVFVYSRDEWVTALSGFFRASAMVGVTPRFPRMRICNVMATSPLHMTARFGMSVDVGIHRMLRLDARRPLAELRDAIAAFRPDMLAGYPSVLALLADEQRAGRLEVRPHILLTTSEVCTLEMSRRISDAFGTKPLDVYASTETGLIAAECDQHRGRHLFEDQVLLENVDEDGQPVPDGRSGGRLLVTNLFNRTQPLIRYELSDMVTLDSSPCPCGRRTPRIVALDGRSDDILVLPGRDGRPRPVHPLAVRSPFAGLAEVRAYQIVHDGALHVRVVPSEGAEPSSVAAHVSSALGGKLEQLGVVPPEIRVELVACLARDGGPSGKLKLIESRTRRPTAA